MGLWSLLPIAVALVLLILLGLRYARQASPTALEVASDDPDLVRAESEARASLPNFLARLNAPLSTDTDFMVKFRLRGGSQPEQIWAENLRREGGRLFGELANDPLTRGYRGGQQVEIPEQEIMDWGYRDAGVMQGDFSTRVFLATMPADVQSDVRREFGWA